MFLELHGASPSGKAAVFGTDIRRFESFRPRIRMDLLNKNSKCLDF